MHLAYRIEYGTAVPLRFQPKRVKRHIRTLTALCILLFSLAVGKCWPEGKLVLQRFFLPGEPTVTEQAFVEMMGELNNGVALEDAVVAFCQQIIDRGAENSD